MHKTIVVIERTTVMLALGLATLLVAGCGSEKEAGAGFVPPRPLGYVAYKTPTPMTVDGLLDEQAWREAPWTSDFVDIEGSLKPAPRFRTRAKMAWDDTYLYIGADIDEPQVWATLRQRDTVIFHDNDFEVFIDPNADNHEYYEFEMNALNTVWDLFLPKPYRDGGSAHTEWNIDGLKTGVHVRGTLNNPADTDSGWTVEIAMPWKALGQYAHKPAPPEDGDQWRINFSRVEWKVNVVGGSYVKVEGRPEDNWVWSPQWVINMHEPELWGFVQFSTGMPGSATFRPDPTWTARIALFTVYKAEKAFRKSRDRYKSSLEELGIRSLPGDIPVTVTLTPEGYVATATSGSAVVHEQQDSRCWVGR
jgi:hypothetical protein